MNTLLIFFALPIAVIILSIALQKILKCPALVASIIFAIFLIVTFVINNLNLLIATIVYAIISFITAYITCILGRFLCRIRNECNCGCDRRRENECSCNHNSNANQDVLTISNFANGTSNAGNGGCGCNQNQESCTYQITNPDGLSARINIVPNTCNQRRR
ncbi:MAG: DUF2651 family protein [Clostridia bacterium]|nr:DUF2651 family protein [Clostridia bacterium]